MKKKTVSLLLAALVVSTLSAVPADARKRAKTERVETFTYQTPAPGVTPIHPFGVAVCNYGGALGDSRGCKTLPVGLDERYATIEVTDATGLPAPGFWTQGETIGDWVPFCGSTPEPVRIDPGVAMHVWVYAYRSPNLPACAGTATTGTVKITFSSHP